MKFIFTVSPSPPSQPPTSPSSFRRLSFSHPPNSLPLTSASKLMGFSRTQIQRHDAADYKGSELSFTVTKSSNVKEFKMRIRILLYTSTKRELTKKINYAFQNVVFRQKRRVKNTRRFTKCRRLFVAVIYCCSYKSQFRKL